MEDEPTSRLYLKYLDKISLFSSDMFCKTLVFLSDPALKYTILTFCCKGYVLFSIKLWNVQFSSLKKIAASLVKLYPEKLERA